ncbi:MAG: YgaP-like transmembrane domain [Tepidisphaeraceae bacterium]|jgi:membrane-bound ClpP family serine protease
MAFTCNIDRRGRQIRMINGIVTVILGIIALFVLAIPRGGVLLWSITIILLFAGAFMIFEGAIGWCALRAMGVKTKI